MRWSHDYPAAIQSEQIYGDILFYGVVIVAAVLIAVALETYLGRRRKSHPRRHIQRIRTMR